MLARIDPKTKAGFRKWLSTHHGQAESVWIRVYKKHLGPTLLSASDVVDQVLCFGWIDSLPRKYDEESFLLLVSPRKPKSVWSAINKKKIQSLVRSKQMTRYGIQKILEAKKDGSWNTLNKSDKLILPKELKDAFAKDKKAQEKFQFLAPSSRRAILEKIYAAKSAETRLKRVRAILTTPNPKIHSRK